MLPGQGRSGCAALSGDVWTEGGVQAVAYEQGDGGVCSGAQAPKGVALDRFGNSDGVREFPWLAAPTFSADGVFMAAERFAESDDPADAGLWGVVAVNTLTGEEVPVAAGASQPAWRPGAAVDPAAVRYTEPGERLVTLETPLSEEGTLYRISYLTTGDLVRSDASFLHLATPAYLADNEITGVVVTADGRPVTDGATLRRILEQYHAAYHLYEAAPPDLLPLLGDELDKVLANPLLMAMSPTKFLARPRDQYAAALRAMLTARSSPPQAMEVLDAAIDQASGDVEAALDALGAIVEDQQHTNETLVALHADLKLAYESSEETVTWSAASLKLLRLAWELLFLRELQQERSGWLQAYVDTFPSGEEALGRDPLRAAVTVLAEVEAEQAQRVNLVLAFVQDEAVQALLKSGGAVTQQAAAEVAAQIAAQYGGTLSAQAVSSLLSAISVGLTANSILYGTDDLVANFQLARRAEELRGVFRAGAEAVQRQTLERTAPTDAYDGELAGVYRTAVLLETLAGVAAYHAYADGVAASQRLPNLLALLNQLRGEDWDAAAAGLHRVAEEAERSLLDDLANSAQVETLVALAVSRMQPGADEPWVEPVTGMAFVPVPAGEFVMGSSEEEADAALALCNASYGDCERSWFADEQPQHTVYLDEYWIGRTEVTNAQYQQFVDAGGYETEGYWSSAGWQARTVEGWERPRCLDEDDVNVPDQPVVCVSWYEAEAYTRWLSEESGMAIRLPTEAEWEKAARGTDSRIFPWGNEFDGSRLNYCDANCAYDHGDEANDDGYAFTAPVGSYPGGASPYGAMDMAGNVWEWVSDWYGEDYYRQSPSANPPGPEMGETRVLRGGSWSSDANNVRSADRDYYNPGNWYSYFGFRCVRSQ
ncbi:MAG: SUMF1/EgtB/PvdO family nonheme iron enzyme [Caldilinea sp.]